MTKTQSSCATTETPRPHRAFLRGVVRGLLLTLTLSILAGSHGLPQSSAHPAGEPHQPPARIPRDWARDVAASEIADILRHDVYFRYRVHVVDHHGDRTREVIEAREGTVSRTVLRNGQPLPEAEVQAERERLTDMLNSPSAFARHIKSDAEGKKLAVDLIQLMPDAMVYTYTPGQPQAPNQVSPIQASPDRSPPAAQTAADPGQSGPGTPSAPQVVIDFRPDPAWKPPTTTAEALRGLRGRMWIDPVSRQILRMEGSVFQGVNLGWGMLAHIYPGGKVVLEQTDAGSHRWIYTRFTEEATVRALMVKTMNIHTTIEAASFQPLPRPVSYQEAIHTLLDAPSPAK